MCEARDDAVEENIELEGEEVREFEADFVEDAFKLWFGLIDEVDVDAETVESALAEAPCSAIAICSAGTCHVARC